MFELRMTELVVKHLLPFNSKMERVDKENPFFLDVVHGAPKTYQVGRKPDESQYLGFEDDSTALFTAPRAHYSEAETRSVQEQVACMKETLSQVSGLSDRSSQIKPKYEECLSKLERKISPKNINGLERVFVRFYSSLCTSEYEDSDKILQDFKELTDRLDIVTKVSLEGPVGEHISKNNSYSMLMLDGVPEESFRYTKKPRVEGLLIWAHLLKLMMGLRLKWFQKDH